MKTRNNGFWIFLPILLLIAGAVLAAPKYGAPKNVSECGTILTEPGNYKLVNDLLDCPGNGVEIYGSDITLNLHGHAISCDNDLEVAGVGVWSPIDAIIRNVTIKNGHISNCRDGIVLIQTENSKVMHITSTGNTKYERAPDVWVYGTLIGTLFFIMLVFAAFTTAISLIEALVAYLVEKRGLSRPGSALIAGFAIWFTGLGMSESSLTYKSWHWSMRLIAPALVVIALLHALNIL